MPRLFSIETDTVVLTWSRPRSRPVTVRPGPTDTPFGLRVEGGRHAPAVHMGDTTLPFLFEQTEYALFVQSQSRQPVRVRHRDPVLVHRLHASSDGSVLHGTLNFGAQVGHSRFVVEAGGDTVFAFEVEVFPSKLDYRSDYEALREDVRAITQGLLYEHLRATYEPGRVLPPDEPGPVGWLALLHHVANDLDHALAYIARQPRWETARTVAFQRADRIRHPDAALRRTVRQHTGRGALLWPADAPPLHERMPTRTSHYTLDTSAHRWLDARLHTIHQHLTEFHEAETRRPASPRRRRVLAEIEALQHRVTQFLRHAFLQEAIGEPPLMPPLTLLAAPGYREAYQACLTLHQGLHLEGGPLGLSLKDLHLLYEYWCFLTLVRLMADLTGERAPLRSLIAVEQDGLRLRLRKGRAQTVRFRRDDDTFDLTYNPRFGGQRYLVPQQPDLLLTHRRRDAATVRYVLDAKYRLDASPGYLRRYGLPGPPADALNTLHRYRDALRPVVQAVALYPYRDAEAAYAGSRLQRLLDEIGVGALPLLPGETRYLERWLRGVLEA